MSLSKLTVNTTENIRSRSRWVSQGPALASAPGHEQYSLPTGNINGQDTAMLSSPCGVEQALLNPSREVSSSDPLNPVSSSACFTTSSAEAGVEPSALLKYNSEIIRLGSFAGWPDRNAVIKPRKMAKAGLFFTGQGDTVQCFQCGRTFSGWIDGDVPLQKHYQENQDCQFARELFLRDNESLRFHSNISSAPSGVDVPDNATSATLNISGHQSSSSPGNDAPDTCIQPMQTLSINAASNACAASDFYAYDTVDSPRNLKNCSEHCPKDLNTELHRVHTFFGWPEGTPVRPERLAKLGFFYLGVRDKVECAFCGGVLHQWEEGDDPKTEHQRHYPHCPFIRNCATSNVPLDNPATPNVPQDSPDSCTEQQSSGQWRNFAQQDSTVEQQSERRGHIESEPPPPPGGTDHPKHPELSSEEDRLSTFFRWPLYSPISPRKLAQAGFYYTYIDDQVKCYWCEGGLKDWQAGDDPWTEHARWYGEECGFVLRERGIGYVRQIKNTFPSLVQVAHHYSQQDFVQDFIVGAANVTVQVGEGDPEDEFEERVLDAMDSRVVRNVVEMGFGQQNVEIVVRRRLRARRGPFTTMTDLVEALLAMDDNEEPAEDPYTEDEEDRNAVGPTPTGNQEPAVEQMEEPEDETPASMEELQRRLQRMKEERMCKICMTNDATMVFIPCGHLCCCEGCAHTMRSRGRKCPICRARILKVQRAFLA
ncbi:baculoviral IAP repeat-containing protein 7-like [Branchiostoma floridae x Branchiostoma japonicum]